MEIIRHRTLGTKMQNAVEQVRDNQEKYKQLIERVKEIEDWRQILETLPNPSRELDFMIYRGIFYPTWYRSRVMSYTLVENSKLTNRPYMSKSTKLVPNLTSSIDAVFKAFTNLDSDENDIVFKRKARVYQKPEGIKWICTFQSDFFKSRGFGINMACAMLDALLEDTLTRIKSDLGELIDFDNAGD